MVLYSFESLQLTKLKLHTHNKVNVTVTVSWNLASKKKQNLTTLPGKINRQNLFSSFLATENAAESPAGLRSSCLVALWELVGIKHGVRHHGVGGHLGAFPSQLQTYLSGYGCRERKETENERTLNCNVVISIHACMRNRQT